MNYMIGIIFCLFTALNGMEKEVKTYDCPPLFACFNEAIRGITFADRSTNTITTMCDESPFDTIASTQYPYCIKSMTVNPLNGSLAIIGKQASDRINIVDGSTLKQMSNISIEKLSFSSPRIECSPDGKSIACFDNNRCLILDWITGKVTNELYDENNIFTAGHFHPKKSYYFLSELGSEQKIKIWDLRKNDCAQQVTTLEKGAASPWKDSFAFSKTGRELTIATQKYLCIYNFKNKNCKALLNSAGCDLMKNYKKFGNQNDYQFHRVAYNPVNKMLVAGFMVNGECRFLVYDRSGEEKPHAITAFNDCTDLYSLSFNADGTQLQACAGNEKNAKLKLWQMIDQQPEEWKEFQLKTFAAAIAAKEAPLPKVKNNTGLFGSIRNLASLL
jgi:WD40 repeat protein